MYCDSHVHVVGPTDRYPQLPGRRVGLATLATLRRAAAPSGISRFVIVQPSFYGTDNTLLLDALDTLAGDGRGVVVTDPAATSAETLAAWARRGVRGLRFNLYSPAGQAGAHRCAEDFASLAHLAATMHWHVEVIAPIDVLADNADVFARSPVPVVLDHYGLHGRSVPDSREGGYLIELLRLPHVWMKLSAPYRVSDDPLSTRPDNAWLAAMLAVAAPRCVWGSDWPHTAPHEAHVPGSLMQPYRDLPYGELVGQFLAALPEADDAERIMRTNPARLYGFGG